jgi:hypothetical protein
MREQISYYQTNDINLASALLALGIPPAPEPFTKHRSIKSDNIIYTFYFQEVSNCGNYKTGEMIKMWDDAELYENSDHPLAYMRCLIHNREGLLDVINKAVEMIVVQKNGKIAVISKNASDDLKKQIISQL